MTTVVARTDAVTVSAGSSPTIVVTNPSVTVDGSATTPTVTASGSSVTVTAGSAPTISQTSSTVTVTAGGAAGDITETMVYDVLPAVGSARIVGDSFFDYDEEFAGATGRNFAGRLLARALGVPDGRVFNDSRASTVGAWYAGPQVLNKFNPGTPSGAAYPVNAHPARTGLAVIWWGRNDVAWLGATASAGYIFKSAMIAAASRYRASKVYTHTNSSIAYTGTWSTVNKTSEPWTTPDYRVTTTTNDEFTITTANNMGLYRDGAYVSLCFMCAQSGAKASVYLDGTLHGQLNIGRGTSYGTASGQVWGDDDSIAFPYIYRLYVPTTAATTTTTTTHTIRVVCDGPAGPDPAYGLRFDSWWVEADEPPPVLFVDMAHSSNAQSIWANLNLDWVITAYNGWFDEICAAFSDGLVRKVQTGTVLEGLADGTWSTWSNSQYFQTDGLHPNEYGGALVAIQVVRAVQQLASDGYAHRLLGVDTDEQDPRLMGYTAVTSAYTVLDTDRVVACNGTFTVTMPDAAYRTGWEVTIKNTGSGTVTVDGEGADTIDGSATKALAAGDGFRFISNGTNWITV